MMKERPILFSGAMVCAILDGRKTQTRRVLKRQPYVSVSNPPYFCDVEAGDVFVCPDIAPTTSVRGSVLAECERPGVYHCMGQKQFAEKHSPYGVPGDRLWVRETFFAFGRWETRFSAKKARDEWHFVDLTLEMDRIYQYVDPTPDNARHRSSVTPAWWKRPAIFMPRAASRIVLEITAVRVERLNECSEADAVAEGCGANEADDACGNYRLLWNSLNGAGAWEANPWVWVVEFRKV
jgi:hypothetical protein